MLYVTAMRFFSLVFTFLFGYGTYTQSNRRGLHSSKFADFELPWNIRQTFPNGYAGMSGTHRVNVAVLDSGVDMSHPDLRGQIAWTYDATGEGFYDFSGHGTHVTGTIAALRDGAGIAGVAPIANIYAIKVLAQTNNGEGEWSWLETAIYKAVQGPDGIVGTADDANVINMSFGSGTEVPTPGVLSAIQFAYAHGVVMVAAAGNKGDGNPATTEINYPAALPQVIAVGASNLFGDLTSFSSSAPYLEVAAPGDMVISTYLNGGYAIWGGTSMSTPHVTGIAALILANNGYMPVGSFGDHGMNTVRGILHSYTTSAGTSWDAGYGYGVVSYQG